MKYENAKNILPPELLAEAEIAAAPIIYKLWLLHIYYYFKGAVWKGDDESAAAVELDYICTLLTSNEIDFREICK